jgi:hypothetical protein
MKLVFQNVKGGGESAKYFRSTGKHPVSHRYATHRWESCSIYCRELVTGITGSHNPLHSPENKESRFQATHYETDPSNFNLLRTSFVCFSWGFLFMYIQGIHERSVMESVQYYYYLCCDSRTWSFNADNTKPHYWTRTWHSSIHLHPHNPSLKIRLTNTDATATECTIPQIPKITGGHNPAHD